jgi:phosphoadenosine phosphosulfate reductase
MSEATKDQYISIRQTISTLSLQQALLLLAEEFKGYTVFSSSFSYEDQIITHSILSQGLPINIFTLDTGRLFAETYSVWNSTNEKYHANIKAYYPNQALLEDFVSGNGPNSFYTSVDNRKKCCYIRKVEPLQRALAGNKVWITGLRAEHSADRKNLTILEWDDQYQLIKYNPLLYWTQEEVKKYISGHQIPYNPLHDQGFVSIGCAPCTRAVKQGEDFRAGRWWWEDSTKKECGLHERQA